MKLYGEESVVQIRLKKKNSMRHALTSAMTSNFSFFLVWSLAALSAVYVKSQVLNYLTIGRAIGRTEIPAMTHNDPSRSYLFSYLERVSFFRSDLLLEFIILPIIFLALFCWIPRYWRMVCVVTVTFATIAFLYLQMNGFWKVGQFQSWMLWYDAIRWGLLHPEDTQSYIGYSVLLKLGACLVATITLGTFSELFMQSMKRSDGRSLFIRMSTFTFYTTIIIATIMSWCSPIQSTPYHRSALSICFRAFFDINEKIIVSKFDSLGPEEILTKWREVTKSPALKPVPDYFGVAKNYDVICFVLETAPSRCLNLNGNMDDLPNLKRLQKQAWVATRHVTTYPYTSSALFSILTSWYPTDINYFKSGKVIAPGFMRSLKMSGYETAAYLPLVAANEEDENLHRSAGISKFIYAEPSATAIKKQKKAWDWHDTINHDKTAMELMKKDISGWISDNRRYSVIYLPQIGHAPWPDLTEDSAIQDVVSRGHAIMVLQDKWLGELMAFLKSVGRLDHTIILVTGDHGIRTKMEDPDFEGGNIDSYSFQVPCVLFAPKTLEETVVIPWMTSHIDLSPSILDLVGVTEGRRFELGSPLWDERLSKRTTFVYANKYLGADGFHENGKYYMWKYISETAYHNSIFDFNGLNPVGKESPVGKHVIMNISNSIALQYRISRLESKKEQ